MRALVQRVSQAAVDVEGARVAQIGPGMLVLLGVSRDDTEADADRLAQKVRALRIFDDADGKMNEPLGDREILCVSQFTLYGDTRKGTRPSFTQAAPGEHRPVPAGPEADVLAAQPGGVQVADLGLGHRQGTADLSCSTTASARRPMRRRAPSAPAWGSRSSTTVRSP